MGFLVGGLRYCKAEDEIVEVFHRNAPDYRRKLNRVLKITGLWIAGGGC